MLKIFNQFMSIVVFAAVFLLGGLGYTQDTANIGPITAITNGQINIFTAPKISGDQIGYLSWYSASQLPQLHIYNITSKATEVVDHLNGASSMMNPNLYWDINDHAVVLESQTIDKPPQPVLYYRNLFTGEQKQIAFNTFNPGIFENRIVYASERYGLPDIFMFDLNSGQETRITQGKCFNNEPAIWDNYVAYVNYACGNDVNIYDLSNQTTFSIGQGNSTGGTSLNMDNYRIVFVSDRDGQPDIYLYDLMTRQTKRITNINSLKYLPKISGDWIIWQEKKVGNTVNINAFNLINQASVVLAQNVLEGQLSFSDNRLIWMDNHTGKYKLYMMTLP